MMNPQNIERRAMPAARDMHRAAGIARLY